MKGRSRNKRMIEDILFSGEDPIAKIQQIVSLGVDEDQAIDVVERYQSVQLEPTYYERLPHEPYRGKRL